MRTILACLSALLIIGTTGGCATVSQFQRGSICSAQDGTLKVSGATDARMLACLEAAGDFDRLEITSEGGSVRNAIAIGRSIAARRIELVVAGYCESACANYLLPAAGQVRVKPGARIVLHGSVDGWALARGASLDLYQLQRDYAAEVWIPPGWLLMRTADEGEAGRHGRFVTGDVNGEGSRYIVVEPSFLASCLPKLPVLWETPTYHEQVRERPARQRHLERGGLASSGTMLCRREQAYPDGP